MAYKKRGKYAQRRRGRRIYRKRRGFKSRTTVNEGRLGPIAPRTIVRLKYNAVLPTSDSAWGTGIDYTFNLNSIYDPDLSGTGHQPLGRDQWSVFYNRYRVFKVSYVITGTAMSGYQNTLAVLPNNSATLFTSPQIFAEQPRTIMKQINGNAGQVLLKGSVYLPSIAGVSKKTYAGSDRYQSLMSSSPSEAMVLHVGHWSSLYGTQDVHGMLNINLVYHVELFDPIPVASS